MRILRMGEAVLCVLLLVTLGASDGAALAGWEIDTTATATRVIDGDTFDAVPVGRVRLADINAPEVGQPGAREATAYLTFLVHRKLVYLDIDDIHGSDRYGRVVAVVYVRHNATHLLNVNAALVDAGHARVWEFPKKFDPATWSLFVYYPEEEAFLVGGPERDRIVGAIVLIASFVVTYLSYPLFRKWKA